MCGILVALGVVPEGGVLDDDHRTRLDVLRHRVRQRGPDASSSHHVFLHLSQLPGHRLHLYFYAAVLHLRGDTLVQQPLVSPDGNVLCFNGELFSGPELTEAHNDTVYLFDRLNSVAISEISTVLSSVEGPFSLVYYRRDSNQLFFARDPLGRRSLLSLEARGGTNGFDLPMVLTSAAFSGDPHWQFSEVSAECLWCLDIQDLCHTTTPLSRNSTDFHAAEHMGRWDLIPQVSRKLSASPLLPSSLVAPTDPCHIFNTTLTSFLEELNQSVRVQVTYCPRSQPDFAPPVAFTAILFSGGIDSTMLAHLASRHVPEGEPIDLLNVAFENPRKIEAGRPVSTKNRKRKPNATHLKSPLEQAYLVPDRLGGLEELSELQRLHPHRQWNFVEINVPFEVSTAAGSRYWNLIRREDTVIMRKEIEDLMYPRNTNMDMSLALALYFASKGEGQVRLGNGETIAYRSTARVLISGLGSDELLGGYGRHRTAHAQGGWDVLADELQLEIDRIWTRNLGRDDRIISSHGKETRHPFLSLGLVSLVAGLPLDYKTDPRAELGIGDKLLLRMAAVKEGLVMAAQRKKKAMQFGSHSARMEKGPGEKSGTTVIL